MSLAEVGGLPALAVEGDYKRGSSVSGAGAWTLTDPAPGATLTAYPSLQIVSGNPALSYFDPANGNLYFSRGSSADGSGVWSASVVDDGATASGDAGQFASLAIVSSNPAIAYFDASNGDLKFARNAASNGLGAWSIASIVTTDTVGAFSSLAIIGGNPAIGFFDDTADAVRFTRNANATGSGAWSTFTVGGTGGIGTRLSLAEVSGNPALAYGFAQVGAGILRFARNAAADGSGAWTTSNVETTTATPINLSLYSSLAIVSGTPAISYYHQTDSSLKFARNAAADGSGAWVIATVDNSADVGQYTSMAIVNGNPAISYYDVSNTALKFARNSLSDGSGTWTTVTVDNNAAVGEQTSLAIINGLPVITYYDATNGDLKFARNAAADGSGLWTLGTVDTAGNVGRHTSVKAIGAAFGVAYYDVTDRNLKFALEDLPEIAVSGNAMNIADGDATPDLTDHTDFGAVAVASGTIVRTFTITNNGTANLTVGAGGLSVTGGNAADFTVGGITLPATIAASGSTTFTVSFDPSASGIRSTTVNLVNNDADENPYTFAIQGTGTAPEIAVLGNSVNIADGDTTPDGADHTDFGSVATTGGTTIRIFTVQNTGTAALNLNGTPKVVVGGAHAADFTVFAQPTSPVASGGGTTTFQVNFDPSASGLRSATVSIANDDAEENPFNFSIQGTVSEINLRGNSTDIASGDTTPSTTDHTDFGSQGVPSGTVVRTFTIQNTGGAAPLL